MATDKQNGPRAMLRGLNVLAHLAGVKNGATLSEISRSINCPKSSLLVILQALTSMGFVNYDGKLYGLGTQATEFAATLMGNNSLIYAANPVLQSTASAIGENIGLANFDLARKKLVYAYKTEGTHAIRFNFEVGDERDLYSSAGGRVVMAHQSDDWIRSYLAGVKLKAYSKYTLTDPNAILDEIKLIRRDGVAHSIEEMFEGGAGFAAPIYDTGGRLISVLVIASIATRARRNKASLRKEAQQAAAEISGRLGYQST